MSKYVETVMPAPGTILDGSWKEDTTYPVRDEMIKERQQEIEKIKKQYKWTDEKAAEWVDDTFYTVKRHDGLRKQIKQRSDGSWVWMVHMKYTYEQQRFYDYVCTM